MNLLILIVSSVFGFVVAKLFAGKKEGEDGILKSIVIRTDSYQFHIHHWILASLFILVMVLLKWYNEYLIGFGLGIVGQGLMYRDRLKIVTSS